MQILATPRQLAIFTLVTMVAYCPVAAGNDLSFDDFVSSKLAQTASKYTNSYSYEVVIIESQSTGQSPLVFTGGQAQQVVVAEGGFAQRRARFFTAKDFDSAGAPPSRASDVPAGLVSKLNNVYLRNPSYSSSLVKPSSQTATSTDRWVVSEIKRRGKAADQDASLDVVTLFAYGMYSAEKSFSELLADPGLFEVRGWSITDGQGQLTGRILIGRNWCDMDAVFNIALGVCLETVVYLPAATLTTRMTYEDGTNSLAEVLLEGVSTDPADAGSTRHHYFFEPFVPDRNDSAIFYLSHFGIAEPNFHRSRRILFGGLLLLAAICLLVIRRSYS